MNYIILNTEQGSIPVEVKSGENTRIKRLKAYVAVSIIISYIQNDKVTQL